MGPIGCPETSERNYHYSVMTQKSAVISYFVAEGRNHATQFLVRSIFHVNMEFQKRVREPETVKISINRVQHTNIYQDKDGFGGLVVSMLASGTQVCGFKPGRSRWIFRT